MKKIFVILIALSLMLAGCGKVHDPSSASTENIEATEDVMMEAEVTATNYTMDAMLVNYQQEDGKHTYTIFVGANDAYSVLKDDCVNYLTEEYQDIREVVEGIQVQVWNVNDTSTQETAAFVQIVSPQILDTKKLFIYSMGTTAYEAGMTFNSVEEYRENYDAETLVSVYLQVSDSPFDMQTLYNTTRPIYESLRLINLGNGYDIIHVSTKDTKSYVEDGTLWTPVNVTYFTGVDYSATFHDVLNNCYVAQGNIHGKYEDIIVLHNTEHEVVMRQTETGVEVGITNYQNNEAAPNCVVGNIILSEDMTTITNEAARKSIIIFFN